MVTSFAIALTVLGGWKAYTADLELPVPKGWSFVPTELQASPRVPAHGGACENSIWFDFFPGANLDYAKQLIATESIDVTAAIRQWDATTYVERKLGPHVASSFTVPDRTVYVLANSEGAVIVQVMAQGESPDLCLPLHDSLATKLLELFFAPKVQAKVKALTKNGKPPPLKVLEPVPADLDQALIRLEALLKPETLAEIRASATEREMFRFHHGLGMGLRNRWGLWGGSPLAKHFQAMGVFHPDDMSGILMRSFWRKLHGVPLDVEAQAAEAKRYWDLRRPPESTPCAAGVRAERLFGLEAPDRFVQIYSCGRAGYRAFELHRGWYEPDAALTKRIEALRTQKGLVSAPLDGTTSGRTVTELPK